MFLFVMYPCKVKIKFMRVHKLLIFYIFLENTTAKKALICKISRNFPPFFNETKGCISGSIYTVKKIIVY